MPESRKAKDRLNAKRHEDDRPRKGDFFVDGCTWAEFHHETIQNKEQVKIDFTKENQVWHYIAKGSTDARAQYTEDPSQARHNPRSNFLDTIPKPVKVAKPKPAQSRPSYSGSEVKYPYSASGIVAAKLEKPYVYKPKIPATFQQPGSGMYTTQRFVAPAAGTAASTPATSISFRQYFGPTGAQQMQTSPQTANNSQSLRADPGLNRGWSKPYSSTTASGTVAPTPPTIGHAAAHVAQPKSPVPAQQRPAPRLSWQIYPEAYQKYPFFQTYYNRDSARYKTPYASGGGFTNGHEGDKPARHASNPAKPTAAFNPSSMPGLSQAGQAREVAGFAGPKNPNSFASTSTGAAPVFASTSAAYGAKVAGHPSIKARYTAGLKQSSPATAKIPNTKSQSSASPLSRPMSSSGPPKQSPVPLPANFLAAMTSSTNSAGSQARQGPVKAVAPISTPHFEPQAAPPPVHSQVVQGEVVPSQPSAVSGPVQDFPDVPGSGSMEFVERIMQNLRRASLRAEDS